MMCETGWTYVYVTDMIDVELSSLQLIDVELVPRQSINLYMKMSNGHDNKSIEKFFSPWDRKRTDCWSMWQNLISLDIDFSSSFFIHFDLNECYCSSGEMLMVVCRVEWMKILFSLTQINLNKSISRSSCQTNFSSINILMHLSWTDAFDPFMGPISFDTLDIRSDVRNEHFLRKIFIQRLMKPFAFFFTFPVDRIRL